MEINGKKYYEGFPQKRFNEYTKEELAQLPPIPKLIPGKDYPEVYGDNPPLYWIGFRWMLIYD